ncbi:ABC transporter permease [Acrocarpospora pleiomorpha]|uniref:ABC transporter permease n=1 Tax=Acrocarpospora pleiomorpha TaxID=90975 RepID=A0A5M3XI17_9ACTN|nr:ABC transporter permease [Acrocarpospora pleiomorpha]GES20600.1 ABC transporter permease [Acrocarpospora pleiomorpha]
MIRRILTRIGTSVLVLWGAVTVSFTALHLTPGNVVDVLIGSSIVTPEVRAQIIADYGLDAPLSVQYATYLGRVLRGDLGQSYQLHESVATAIGTQLGPSIQLAGAALLVAVTAATTLALLTARRKRWIRGLSSGLELIGVSIPTFWAAILLLTVFSFQLGWFPAVGDDSGASLVLPVIAVAIPITTMLTQMMRESLELTLEEPFVLTARSRGMSDLGVRLRHALRHALVPAVTLLGWVIGLLVGSMVAVEQIFSRQGLGQLTLTAVTGKDLPVVMGVVLVTAVLYVVVNILIDLLYLVIDPRLRSAA